MVRIREIVFSLLFAWLGYERRPKVRFEILCQPLPYPLPNFLIKWGNINFSWVPLRFFMKKYYLKVKYSITQAKQNFVVLNISARQFPGKWTQKIIKRCIISSLVALRKFVLFFSSARSTLDAQLIAPLPIQ